MADYDSSDYLSSTQNAQDPTYDPSTDTMRDYGSTNYGGDFYNWLQNPTGSDTGFGGLLKGIGGLFTGETGDKLGQFAAFSGLGAILNKLLQEKPQIVGYQYPVPRYTATRTQTPIAQQRPTTRIDGQTVPYRPGQGGISYFSPIQYSYAGYDPKRAQQFIQPVASQAAPAPAPAPVPTPAPGERDAAFAGGGYMPNGIAMLAGGRYLRGPGDGVSDSIHAKFERSGEPARLADGEFVIDARTVSELGNGSSEAGARKLYAMMDRVHKARKTAQRGKPSGADRELKKLVRG